MCHDLSFSAATVEFITEVLPNIIIDGQLDMDLSTASHVLSMSNRKCLVVTSQDGVPHLKTFEWGMIANFMRTPDLIKQYRIQMANARSEKIFDKKSTWYEVKKNRCLIAVDGFFEHRKIKGWKNKVPYMIKLIDQPQLFLLGLYNYSPIPDIETGELRGTFAVITEGANGKMKNIHNDGLNKHRMPVLMQPKDALKWIQEDLTDDQMKEMLEYEIPSEQLDEWPVYTIRSTNDRPDGKSKTDRFDWPGLPALGNDEPIAPPDLFSLS